MLSVRLPPSGRMYSCGQKAHNVIFFFLKELKIIPQEIISSGKLNRIFIFFALMFLGEISEEINSRYSQYRSSSPHTCIPVTLIDQTRIVIILLVST